MANEKFINTFSDGLNSDISFNKYPNSTYYDAVDLRLISDEELSNGALVNFKGTKAKVDLIGRNYRLIGHTNIDDRLILFLLKENDNIIAYTQNGITGPVHDNEKLWVTFLGNTYKFYLSETYDSSVPPPVGYDGYILVNGASTTGADIANELNNFPFITKYYDIIGGDISFSIVAKNYGSIFNVNCAGTTSLGINEDAILVNGSCPVSKIYNIYIYDDDSLQEMTLLFSDETSISKLNFNVDNPIQAIALKETNSINKVYWVDGLNEFRYINLNKSYLGREADLLNIIPNLDGEESISTSILSGGNYKAGVVQHAYQFFNKYGSSSTISQLSFPIKLTSYKTSDGGDDIEDNTSSSIKIDITSISQNTISLFNRIRIYAIYYTDYSSVPSINIVNDYELNSSTFSCVDIGNPVGNISYEEFVAFNESTYIPTTIESKNNRLFIANIDEQSFQSDAIDLWDSRAYRFNVSGTIAEIFDVATNDLIYVAGYNHASVEEFKVVSTGENVPPNHDCHNKYNDIYGISLKDRNDLHNFICVSNGSELGGEGINVKYTFVNHSKILDYKGNISNTIKHSKDDLFYDAVGGVYTKMIECMAGEVYRIGIKFYNSKGQSSFVKWVGDVLFSDTFNSTNKAYFGTGTNTLSYYYPILVEIKNFPDDPDIVSWEVVRAIRTDADKSVIANGLLSNTWRRSTNSYYRPYANGASTPANYRTMIDTAALYADAPPYGTGDVSKRICQFISPDIMFNNSNIGSIDDCKIRVANIISNVNDISSNAVLNTHTFANVKLRNLSKITNTLSYGHYSIDSWAKTKPQHAQDDRLELWNKLGAYSYLNQAHYVGDGDDNYAGSNSGVVIMTTEDIAISSLDASTFKYFYASLLRDVDISRYGGITYEARFNTVYVPFSDVFPIETKSAYCVYGDTYTSMFGLMHYILNDVSDDGREGGQEFLSFPIQSQIDLRYRLDNIPKYLLDGNAFIDNKKSMFIQETVAEGIAGQPGLYDEEIGDLYRYNTVYSKSNDTKKSYIKPFDFVELGRNSVKVMHSDPKINGESIDSWTIFKPNNFIELETQYGDINELISFGSKMYSFQENGISLLSINEREVLSTTSGNQLAVGTGGILSRYDYISNNLGIKRKEAIITTNDSIYFIDEDYKAIFDVRSLDKSLSKSLGLNNLVKNLITLNHINDSKLCIGYDPEFNEVLFTIHDKTLCYNCDTNRFYSRYSTVPKSYLCLQNKLFSYIEDETIVDTDRYLFAHNKGAIGDVYSEVKTLGKSTSLVSLIINPNGNDVNQFFNLDFKTDLFTSTQRFPVNDPIIYETFDRINFRNSYMNKDVIIDVKHSSGDPGNTSRRLRSFRTDVPLTSNGNRFLDTFIMVTLEYDNDEGKFLRIHDIITYYAKHPY